MTESIDVISLNMEKIYLGGKVLPLLLRFDFSFFLSLRELSHGYVSLIFAN